MKKAKEIKGLKCPNHDYVSDNYHFIYETTGGVTLIRTTLCLRCGYTKALHKIRK